MFTCLTGRAYHKAGSHLIADFFQVPETLLSAGCQIDAADAAVGSGLHCGSHGAEGNGQRLHQKLLIFCLSCFSGRSVMAQSGTWCGLCGPGRIIDPLYTMDLLRLAGQRYEIQVCTHPHSRRGYPLLSADSDVHVCCRCGSRSNNNYFCSNW